MARDKNHLFELFRLNTEDTDDSDVSVSETHVPGGACFADLKLAACFRRIYSTKDKEFLRGGLKGIIMNHCTRYGLHSGTISEGASYQLLVFAKLSDWCKENGMPAVVFSGIHSSTFHILSSHRLRMTVDLYIDHFLPALAKRLREETGIPEVQSQMLYEAIVFPMFGRNLGKAILLRGNILVDFTSVNRGYFSKRFEALQNLKSFSAIALSETKSSTTKKSTNTSFSSSVRQR